MTSSANGGGARSRSDQHSRIDPELMVPLTGILSAFPGGLMAISDLDERRGVEASLVVDLNAQVDAARTCSVYDDWAPGFAAGPPVPVRVYEPRGWRDGGAAVLFIHGGGMVSGNLDAEHSTAVRLCETLEALVVSVGYRTAPEDPYPAPGEDCLAALLWMDTQRPTLGYDVDRLIIWGGSAGGNLCLATAMKSRDVGGPCAALLVALYPMVDHRNVLPSTHSITDVGIWDRERNLEAWRYFLQESDPDGYAAPLHGDLRGLPPVFLDVGDVDLFRDEVLALTAEFVAQGVTCEFHLYPGVYHAAELFAPDSRLGRHMWEARFEAVRRAVGRSGVEGAVAHDE